MRRIQTNVVCAFLALVTLIPCQSCSNESQDIANIDNGPLEVGLYAGGVAQTRTHMQPDGLSAVWESGDELALWAKNSSGSYVLANQIFKTYGIDGDSGYFTSVLASAMPEDNYTYYCCYPVPVASDGTKVTFDIPAVQDGKVSGGADIMIADPQQYGPLTAIPEPEDHSGMSLSMNRMLHQFRFYVPEDNTALGDEQITRIVLTFPRSVVGRIALDLADADADAVLSDGGTKVTLNLASPLKVSSASERNYACVAIVPTAFAQGETMRVQAYTSSMIAQVDSVDLCARDFQAGHSTPVKLKVNAITDYPYKISFKLSANNLGEKPNSITLAAPSGCIWSDGGTNVYTYAPGGKIEVNQEFTFRFEDAAAYQAFSGKSISVTYDSDNALTYQTVTVPNLASVNSASVSLTVPYLFFEDFSSIPSYSDGHDAPKVGTSSDTYKGITELSSTSLNNWYGTRIGVQGGTAMRICCRYEHVLLAGAYYKGRAYTPFLSGIKDGKDVKISVSFRYGSNREERKPVFGSRPNKSAIMYFGVNTQDVVTNPDQSEGDIIDGITGMVAGSGFSSSAPTSLSPMVIKGDTMNTSGGSYTSFEGTKTVTIDNVDNGMRLAWIVTTNNTSSNTNGNYWLYLDDIKVQLAN